MFACVAPNRMYVHVCKVDAAFIVVISHLSAISGLTVFVQWHYTIN